MLIAAILISVCLTILVGMPIAGGLALVAIGTMLYTTGPDLLVIFIQRAYAATTSFPLLAIPFFVLAGNLMNAGGTTGRIFAVANLMVGRIRGGLAQVNVIGSMIFAGMSGSAVADAAGLGAIEIKAMVKEGYTARYSATISAVSATIGPIIPPSIPFVIYGSLANVSVGALFLAGIVPGLLMGMGLMIAIAIESRRLNLPRSSGWPALPVALRTIGQAAPALALPPAVLAVIFTGVATPTEAAVVAAAFAFVLGRFVYRELTLASFWDTVWESGRQTVQVMLIIAMAAPFGWVLIQQQVPNALLTSLMSLSKDPWVILLIVNVVLLILGMFLEAIAILIIAYPILAPVMAAIGVDPVHFGVIMVLNLMIGLVTPPVGLCLYVVSGIAKVPIADVVRELAPYLMALLGVLLIVTYVPAVSTWLPNFFGYGVVR
ncbi:MAG: TRAP transporter large permease [Ramlibacter sp.]|nr:TRAP transporter large permease [Ramlibacter sp.]